MITIEEAKKIIEEVISRGKIVSLPIEQCFSGVIAKELRTPLDFPLFSSSAMDGYAICHEDTLTSSPQKPVSLKISGPIFAGDAPEFSIQSGEAVQIMTGAMLPQGANAVIPQEEVLREVSQIQISRVIKKGENVRNQGEEIRQGEVAIEAFEKMTPALIGYLMSLGIREIPTFAKPRVMLIPTGSELIQDIQEIKPGKIFESNAYALKAAMEKIGVCATVSPPIKDEKTQLQRVIQTSLENHDFVLISGGVSVGEKDYVREILSQLGVQTLFWKVAQKPGKPLFFGRREKCFVFGLPGNPASSLVCFYEYVKPALLKGLGFPQIWPHSEQAILTTNVSKKDDRVHFLRAQAERKENKLYVTPLSSQESHRMASFAKANCFAIFPKEIHQLEEGCHIEIHWL